jgi:hypothetical protein
MRQILKLIPLQLIAIIILMLCGSIKEAFALEQNEKLWAGINVERPLSEDNKWFYLLYTQTRLINKSHPWQSTLFEGAVGYLLLPNNRIWLGYRWTAHNPNNGFFESNRLWQQYVFLKEDDELRRIVLRSRLEEIEYTNQSQISFRFRERVSFEQKSHYFGALNPFIYDEAFFQLNETNYSSNRFLSENRLFLGCNWYLPSKNFWEIGYINQYLFNPNRNNQNVMDHVLSFSFNFV